MAKATGVTVRTLYKLATIENDQRKIFFQTGPRYMDGVFKQAVPDTSSGDRESSVADGRQFNSVDHVSVIGPVYGKIINVQYRTKQSSGSGTRLHVRFFFVHDRKMTVCFFRVAIVLYLWIRLKTSRMVRIELYRSKCELNKLLKHASKN